MNRQNYIKFRETDIRPDDIMENQIKFIEADRNYLLSYENDFVEILCPACNSKDYQKLFIKNDLKYVICSECATVFINPRPTQKILEDFYANSQVYEYWNKYVYPASDDARREYIFRPRVEKIIDICKKNKFNNVTLIEVGAGFGTFCEEAINSNYFKDVIAIEPTINGAESCKRKNIEVIQKPIEKVKLNDDSVDIIVSFEVIEHLFSPKEFIGNCARVLKVGGLIVITCPNIKGFDNVVLGKDSGSLDHEHLNLFHPDSLALLISNCGFKIIDIFTPGKLDAEIVRKQVLKGNYSIKDQPFLYQLLIERWDDLGDIFQTFLSENMLSSHMWIVAQRTDSE